MFTEPRTEAITKVYLHTNEGPQEPGGARNLQTYLLGNGPDGGGYHVVVDNESVLRCANDDQVTWGEGGDNSDALSLCFVGYAAQTPADWAAPYAAAQLALAVPQVAAWCKAYGIPAVHGAPGAPGAAPTAPGIYLHADDHDPLSEGHTDPGSGFPIDAFVADVVKALSPIDWEALHQLLVWEQDVTEHPLTYQPNNPGAGSWAITALKQMLNKIGEGPGNDTSVYGLHLVECVKQFKIKHPEIGDTDGQVFGGPAAHVLLKLL